MEQKNGTGGDWKVVYGTKVRGRHGDSNWEKTDIEILVVGRDSNFEGLRVQH